MLRTSNKPPANTAFKQQRLRACQPIYTPVPVIITFALAACIFLPLGGVILGASDNVVEYEERYDDVCTFNSTDVCELNIKIDEKMEEPVYFYYKLTNYYQNHRRYVKSRNDDQLSGDVINDVDDLSSCDPRVSVDDDSDPSAIWLPCGLIAGSMFNDTFVLLSNSSTVVEFNKDDIAWESDLDKKFDNPPAGQQQGTKTPNVDSYTDPDFVVWMRVSALPTFRKLYGVIEQDLDEGEYTVEVGNFYPVDEFDGEKYIIISTSSWMGGKNNFIGVCYLVIGSLSVAFCIAFVVAAKIKPRKLGDLSYVNFQQE
mmetsp:Transcript_2578/g.3778  ORF Transcript_2578/g.3778 Transcript_2578/m.3778 type:complete len:313 (-) Transcript_2578:34-972(-)